MSTATYQANRFLRFLELLKKIYINVDPCGFQIKGGPRNEPGQNVGSCAILALGAMLDWPIWRVELYFAEHARHVRQNPFGHDHPNLRALLRHHEETKVSQVVKFF